MKKTTLATLGLLCALVASTSKAAPLGTAISYQGKLNVSGTPASGSYDLKFTLFDTASGGSAVAGPLATNAVGVVNGEYTVTLDFGSVAFSGDARWMETAVRTNGGGDFMTLSPRQPIEPLPYALYAPHAGSVPAANLTGAGTFTGDGSGLTNINANMLGGRAASGYWSTAGNTGTSPGTHFVGTTDNQALELKVNGQRALRLEPNTNGPNVLGGKADNSIAASAGAVVVAGGAANSVAANANHGSIGGGYGNALGSGAYASTIAGGQGNAIQGGGERAFIGGGYLNTIQSVDNATIAGGRANIVLAGAASASIGGGYTNTAGGLYATIGGGYGNSIQTNANYTTIGGGRANVIQSGSFYSTISGGNGNTAYGDYSMVPGGYHNSAAGSGSFAAGHQAQANHSGTFVWADSQALAFASTAGNQFLIRAAGGVGVNTNNPAGAAMNVAGTVRVTSFQGDGGDLTGLNAVSLTGIVPLAQLPPAVVTNNEAGVTLSGTFTGTFNGSGVASNRAWLIAGNAGTTPGSDFLGTTDNKALELWVNGRRALRLDPHAWGPNVILGETNNAIAASSSVIGGGRTNAIASGAADSVIAGGHQNAIQLNAFGSVISGGEFNRINTNAYDATISGGNNNSIGPRANCAMIAGGTANSVGEVATMAAIGGGFGNSVLPNAACGTIPGGLGNIVGGTASFAAGQYAAATNHGAFVWADGSTSQSGTLVGSSTDRSWTVLASGGVRFFSNTGMTTGASLAPGGGSWTSVSDRAAKENLRPVNTPDVLAKVAALPLATWNYRSQDGSIRHIGPMSQDFKAAFGVGESDTGITTIDADGVALAAIQGLHQLVQEKDAEIQALKTRVERLEQLLNSQNRGGQ